MGGGLSLGTLSIAIEAAVDQALQDFQKFGAEVGKVIDEQKQKWDGLKSAGESLSSVGTTLSLGITAPILAVAGASAAAAAGFEASMNKIVAVSDATGGDLEALRAQAMKLGADTKYSAKEAADGMGDLAAAGLTTAQTMAAMPGVLDLAAAGTLSVSRAAEVTSETLGQFGLSAGAAGHVADVFAKGAAASAISAEQLAQSMKLVGPVANLAGLSLEQTTAAVALLGNSGLKATEAGTGLRGILATLEAPSTDAAKAMKALGIETKDAAGNLLPLDQIMLQLKTSGAGAAEIFDIFGRESAAAASVLMQQSGPAWAAMTAEIDKADGAAKKMADTLNSGVAGAMEQFKGSVETAGIALGQSLEPVILAILGVATKLVNDFLLPAVEWFGKLPAPVQAFALTIVALAAALGPVLLIAGQLAVAIGALMPIITAAAGAIGVSVLALGGWVIAIAAVVAGLVALGVWVYQNWNKIMAVIQDALAAVIAKIAGFVEWLAKLVPATSAVGQALNAAAKSLQDYGKQASDSAELNRKLQKTQDDQTAATKKAKEEAAKAAGAHTDLAGALDKLKTGHEGAAGAATKHAGATKEETDAAKALAKEAKACADEFKPLIEKNDVLYAIASKLSAAHQKLANDIAAAKLSGVGLTKEFGDGMAPALEKVNAETGLLVGHFDNLTGSNGLPKVLEKLGQIKPAIDPAVGSIASMNAGLRALGITSAAEFAKIAKDAQTAYDKVIAAPDATKWEKDSALLKLLEAQKQAMIANGQEIPAAMQKLMADLNKAVEQNAPRTNVWDQFFKDVKAAAGQFKNDVLDLIVFGKGGSGEYNKGLDDQAADLRQSLAERTADWAAYQDEVSKAQSDAAGDYAAALADNEHALGESLAKLGADYQDYAAGVQDNIDGIVAKHAAAVAEQVQDAQDALAEQQAAYTEFATETADKISGIRAKYADSLADEEADLQDSLEHRASAYADFAQDAGEKLARIGEDTATNIQDETRDTESNISDRTKDYNRYAEDIQKKIAAVRLKNKGVYSAEESDLETSLKRKKEDLDQYAAEQRDKLARYTRDQQTRLAREEEDNKESLDRRARDEAEWLADTMAKHEEKVSDLKAGEDREVAAAQTALDKRTAALAAFTADTKLKIEDIQTKHAQAQDAEIAKQLSALAQKEKDYADSVERIKSKSEEQKLKINADYEATTTKLNDELTKQAAAYEAFKADIMGPGGKLDQLKEAHRTIWQDIGDMGKAAMQGIGSELLHIASDQVLGAVMKKLGGLSDIIGDIGSSLSGVISKSSGLVGEGPIPGGIPGGVPGGAPSGGGAGGVASAVSGGLTGWISAISGAVTAISSVIGNFQMAGMNKSLDIIVQQTLKTANDLFNLRRDDWDRHAEYALWKDDFLTTLWATEGHTGTAIASLQAIETHCYNASATLADMLTDSRTSGPAATSFMDDVVNLLGRMSTKLETLAAGAGATMNLYGTDPVTVAAKIATQLRLQGGRA
jgi:TP901 family phage tail tape measure protein